MKPAEMSVSELAALVGGQLAPGTDGEARITGAAGLAEAHPGDITFISSPKYLPALRKSKATAAFVPADFAETIPAVCIRCENPAKAFALFLARIAPPVVVYPPGIHPTATIAPGAKIGEGVCIQAYTVIEDGAEIGDRTIIGTHCYIGHGARVGTDCHLFVRVTLCERAVVGNRVTLHSGVVLGTDGFGYELKEGRYVKVPQTGIVQIDDDVEIGANTSIDRARFGRTWIQAGCKIDNLVQIGHNVVVGKHTVICSGVGIAGSVVIGNYVTLAGQVGVTGHVEIGDQAILGGQAGVTKSLPGKDMYMGYPAMPAKEFREQNARVRNLERLRRRVAALEQVLSERMKSLPPRT